MKFTVIDHPQRSPEWLRARAGRVTGSRAKDFLSKGRKAGEESVGRRDYRLQLAAEILTDMPQDDVFTNAAMQWGIDHEDAALAAYEGRTGEIVRRTGFIQADGLRVGCSLDGDVDDFAGIIEIKCPKTVTHLEYLRLGTLSSQYCPQVTHNLWVTGAKWCDFVSYDPRLPADLQLFVTRVTAEQMNIPIYQDEVLRFLLEVEAEVKAINELRSAA